MLLFQGTQFKSQHPHQVTPALDRSGHLVSPGTCTQVHVPNRHKHIMIKEIYGYFDCMPICVHHMRTWMPRNWSYRQCTGELSYMCWDLNLGPLEESTVLLTAEQFLQPNKINLQQKTTDCTRVGCRHGPVGTRACCQAC